MKMNDLPAFHTHFINFGGVGIDEKGWKHQNKQNTLQFSWFGAMLKWENYDFHKIWRKSFLTPPKWTEKYQELNGINENTPNAQNKA